MSDSIQRRKQMLRKEMQKKRSALSKEEATERSARIVDLIFSNTLIQPAKVIHCYVPISHKKEVDTTHLLEKVMESGRRLVVPKIAGDNQLEHYAIQSLSDLLPNSWGVREPVAGSKTGPGEIDVVFVPMVAGDRFKNRLGYGKGFYDRFLAKTNAKKIGLLYDFQLLDEAIPANSFDIPLDILVTDRQVIT